MQLFPITARLWNALPGRACSSVESASVLRMLAACSQAAVAVPPMLMAWGASQRVHQAKRVQEMAGRLEAGESLDDVVAGSHATLLDEHVVAVRFGERLGLLSESVQAAVKRDHLLSWRYRVAIGYLAMVLLMFLVVAGFLSLRIVPIYAKIVDEFGMERPASLALAWGLSGYVVAASAMVPLVLALAVVLLVSRRLRRRCAWPLRRGERAAAALDLLGVAVAAGQPLAKAAEALASVQSDRRLARRLEAVVTDSASPRCLARLVGGTAAEQFSKLSKPADRGWLLKTLAARRRERSRRRWTLAAEWLVPVGVLLMGLLVLIESLAVLGPLQDLVGGLS
jgi:type II secretory pathway component PulF